MRERDRLREGQPQLSTGEEEEDRGNAETAHSKLTWPNELRGRGQP